MKLSESQIRTSLRALRDEPSVEPTVPVPLSIELLTAEVLEHQAELPRVRVERVAAVRARMEAGRSPSSDDLARKMVGRLVCDRLR